MKKTKKTKKTTKISKHKQSIQPWKLVLIGIIGLALFAWLFYPHRAKSLPIPPDNALYKQSSAPIDDRVNDLVSRMSLDEKIGQMALVDKNSLKNLKDVSKYSIGAVLSGGGVKPDTNTPQGWVEMITGYEIAADTSRLKIPILYGIDANHGNTNVPGATVFPHFIGLGAAHDPVLTQQVAKATAEELSAVNVNWSYSPTLDAPKDIRWGRVYEAFSDDPVLIAQLGQAYVQGLQESELLATAKHYVATGAMVWGESDNKNFKIDQGKVIADEQALNNEYLPPFAAASNAGVASIMVGLQKWGNESIITNEYLLTQKLKAEIGFKGFLVSDWYGVYERAGNKYTATVKAINAGLDMAMLPFDYKGFVQDVHRAVDNGDIKQSRIDDAVSRILRQKFKAGLFEKTIETGNVAGQLGTSEHRAIARDAVAKSAVLLKNNAVLPLSKSSSILVAGSGADNVGRQSGAWTVEWQGIDGNWLPGGTSILKGIQDHASNKSNVQYDLNANFSSGTHAAVGIAIVSEKPYAEGWGDNANPTISKEDLMAIERLKQVSDKVIVVILSGRPLLLNQEQNTWDGLVAAWLPGSEGSGVADVLYGDKAFSGTLPLPWPASLSQLPIETNGITADGTTPTYPRGYGLTL